MEIEIREIDSQNPAQDVVVIADLAREIWTEHYVPIIGQAQVTYMLDRFQSAPSILSDIIENGYRYWLAEGSEPIGYCGAVIKSDGVFLSKIYVLARYRGHGVARGFFHLVRQWCLAAELPRIWLTVNKYNTGSVAAYQRLGFATVDAVVTQIGEGYVMDDYVMECLVSTNS